jgi:hypothetical protein
VNLLKRIMPYIGLLILAGLIYDGAIFYSRWSDKQKAEQIQKDAELTKDRKVAALVGDGVKILSFYAAPGTIARGAHTNLCYGVSGAKNVKLDPPAGEVWPALTRCVPASPKKDTEYTLTVDDGAGHNATETIAVKVKP